MGDLISREALIDEIKNGKDKPPIYDGMQEAIWIKHCIRNAPIDCDYEKVWGMLEELHNYACFPTEWVGEKEQPIYDYFEKETKKILDYLSKSAANATNGKIGG